MSAPWDNLFSIFALQGKKFDPTFYQNALDAADICGVGIMFKSDMSGALFVSSVVPDGPAHKAGNIMEGDVLFEVDGINVYRCPASQCASSLMGPRGSKVRICFLRKGTPLEVTMIRDIVQTANGPPTESNPSVLSELDRHRRNPAFKTHASDGFRSGEASDYDASRRTSQASQTIPQSDAGFHSPRHRWEGLWEGGWSPEKGRVSPEVLAASRMSSGSFGKPPLAQEELQRIKEKLDRQERWAETLGPNSPFADPQGRPGRRTPPHRLSPKVSPRVSTGVEVEGKAGSAGRTTPREEDPNLESIRKKLDRQDKWVEKIFQQDKAKKRAAGASKRSDSAAGSLNGATV